MAQNYTRQSSFNDGDTITASLFNDEYNQLVNSFTYSSTSASSTGHRHDGSAGQGGNIFKIGDLDFLNKIEVDSTNNRWGFYVEVSSAAVEQIRIQDGAVVPVTDNDIDLGTTSLEFKDLFIDGTAHIDTLDVDENATVTGTLGVTGTTTLTGNVTTTNDLSVGGNLTVTGTTTFNGGTITMGDAATDNVVFGADVDSNIIPDDDDTYDLGSSSQEWRNLYIDGTANIDSLIADTADINGGTIDGATIATSDVTVGSGKTLDVSAGTLTLADNQISGDKVEGGTIAATTITSLASTTVDTTNLEVTNIKAKDGASAGSIADTTGVVTLASSVLTTTDINGGTIDGTVIGGTTAAAVSATTVSATGNITVGGTVDGRDVAADGTKLDTVETNADVTDTANVTAAGALMDSELTNLTAVKALNQGVATTDSPAFAGIDVTGEVVADAYDIGTLGTLGSVATDRLFIATADGLGLQFDFDNSRIVPVGADGSTYNNNVSLGSSGLEFKNLLLSGNATVGGTVTADGLTVDGATDGTAVALLRADNNSVTKKNTLRFEDTDTTTQNDQQIGRIEFYSNDTEHTGVDAVIEAVSATTGLKELRFLTSETANTPLSRLAIGKNGDISFYEDTGTTAKFFWDSSAESLGVGTSSPSSYAAAANNLVIADSGNAGMTIASGTTSEGALYFADGTSGGDVYRGVIWYNHTNNFMGFSTDTTERMRIDSSGNVGIGTSNPSSALHVSGDYAANGSDIQLTNTNAGRSWRIGDGIGGITSKLVFFDGTASAARMVIDSLGNVGIGVSSPDSVLEANVTTSGSGANNNTVGSSIGIGSSGTTQPLLGMRWTGNAQAGISGQTFSTQIVNDTVNSNALEIYSTGASPVVFGTAATERMRIDSSGNVGIGEASPDELLVVNGGAKIKGTNKLSFTNTSDQTFIHAAASNVLAFGTASAERMRIDSSGNVKIATSNSGGDVELRIQNSAVSSGDTATLRFSVTSNSAFDSAFVGSDRNNALILGSNAAERMRIDSSGNVGIGRVPNANGVLQLNVATGSNCNVTFSENTTEKWLIGNVTSSDAFRFYDLANSAERMRIDSSGNLLVGTTSAAGASSCRMASSPTNVSVGVLRVDSTLASDQAYAAASFVKKSNDSTTNQVFIRFGINQYNSGCGQINANGVSQAAFGAHSDRRLKENIADLPSQLENITALRPVEFDYIESEGGGHQIGFIAQEVEEIYPDLVGERHDGMKTLTGINKMEARLIKAIQEQNELINDLRARVAQLEGAN